MTVFQSRQILRSNFNAIRSFQEVNSRFNSYFVDSFVNGEDPWTKAVRCQHYFWLYLNRFLCVTSLVGNSSLYLFQGCPCSSRLRQNSDHSTVGNRSLHLCPQKSSHSRQEHGDTIYEAKSWWISGKQLSLKTNWAKMYLDIHCPKNVS